MQRKYVYIEDKVFFNKSVLINRFTFINLFHVKYNSYLYNLYSRLYDYILGNCINLYKEYKKYYSGEFANMREFLIERYNMNDEQLNMFCHKKSYYKLKYNSMDNPTAGLLYIDEIKGLVSEYVGGELSEN